MSRHSLVRAGATRLLLAENADVSITDSGGNTALHMASFLGNTTVVEQLLDAGADPMLRNELGFNSVDQAASPWNAEQEEYLIALSEQLRTRTSILSGFAESGMWS